jgi:hypothetical protein
MLEQRRELVIADKADQDYAKRCRPVENQLAAPLARRHLGIEIDIQIVVRRVGDIFVRRFGLVLFHGGGGGMRVLIVQIDRTSAEFGGFLYHY